jgi:anti-sigma B factor antagonist
MSHPHPFQITERNLGPDRREIRIEGELDLAVADQLKDALDRAALEDGQVLISLEECRFIDSTGIAIIVEAYHRFSEKGGRLGVYAPSGQVLRVLELSGLTANGLAFGTLEEALAGASLNPSP